MWKTDRGSLLFGTALVVTPLAGAKPNTFTSDDWNQWRGPHRVGVVDNLPSQDWPKRVEQLLVQTAMSGLGLIKQ